MPQWLPCSCTPPPGFCDLLSICIASGAKMGYVAGITELSMSPFPNVDIGRCELAAAQLVFNLIGVVVAGLVADSAGRRSSAVGGDAVFVIGALGQALAPHGGQVGLYVMLGSRFLLYFGLGACTLAKPLMVAEACEPARRGVVVGSVAFAMGVGIGAAHMLGGWCDNPAALCFRPVLAAPAIPAAVTILLVLFSFEEYGGVHGSTDALLGGDASGVVDAEERAPLGRASREEEAEEVAEQAEEAEAKLKSSSGDACVFPTAGCALARSILVALTAQLVASWHLISVFETELLSTLNLVPDSSALLWR